MLHRRLILVAITTIGILFSINSTPAFADDSAEETVASEGNPVLEITPVTKRVALEAGKVHDSTISVTNTGSEELAFRVYAKPFSVSEDGATQDFDAETVYTQIARWITIKTASGAYEAEASFSIAPLENKIVNYKINTPAEVPGGGQYAVIFIEAKPKDESNNSIQTISRVGMTLYAAMPGEPKRSVHIKNVDVGSFVLGQGIGAQTRVENDGNIDFQTSVNLTVSSIFGKQLYTKNVISSIFPESVKTIYASWDDAPSFGVYRVDYSVSALDVYTSGSQYVLVLTPVTLTIAVVLLVSMIMSITYLIKRRASNGKDAPDICIG